MTARFVKPDEKPEICFLYALLFLSIFNVYYFHEDYKDSVNAYVIKL